MQNKNKTTNWSRLRNYNFFMGFLHLVQGVFMWAVSNQSSLPVTTNYLRIDPENPVFSQILTPEKWFDLRVGPTIAVFLLLSAVAHLLSATVLWGRYKHWLSKKINPIRWYEYALSSSLMIVVIAMLSGVYDAWTLFAIFGINACMNLFGFVMEVHNNERAANGKGIDWTSYLFGVFAGLVPWVVILTYFLQATSGIEDFPKFVYGIIVSLILLFNTFAINMFLQYKKIGPWKHYMFGEYVYMFLSLLAKTALAWQIWGGTLRDADTNAISVSVVELVSRLGF